MRTIILALTCLSGLSFLGTIAQAADPTPAQVELVNRFVQAVQNGDSATAVDIGEQLLVERAGEVSAEELASSNDIVIAACLDGLRADVADGQFSDAWLDRASKLWPPTDPTSEMWSAYGVIQTFLAAGRMNQGRTAEAKVAVAAARHYLSTGSSPTFWKNGAPDLTMVDRIEASLPGELRVGDYVTNSKGVQQQFIGRVTGVADGVVQVQITYSLAGTQWVAGQMATIATTSVTPLKAVSIDAVVHGWM